MSQPVQATPRPISHTGILRLLAAAGAGAKIELMPEHILAIEAGLLAMAFQQQVKQLVLSGHPVNDQRPAPQPDQGKEKPEPRPSDKAKSRPERGTGAIWTDEEKASLSLRWDRGDSIGQIAEEHQRTAMACFARLRAINAIKPDEITQADESAAHFLIKSLQFVAKTNAADWQPQAAALGWTPEHAAPSRPMGPR